MGVVRDGWEDALFEEGQHGVGADQLAEGLGVADAPATGVQHLLHRCCVADADTSDDHLVVAGGGGEQLAVALHHAADHDRHADPSPSARAFSSLG